MLLNGDDGSRMRGVCLVVMSQDMCDPGVCILMLVTWHLCNVVFTGAPGVPDLRSAAEPGADRWSSMAVLTTARVE